MPGAPCHSVRYAHRDSTTKPGELKEKIGNYASSVGFAFAGIYLVDGSRRSQHSNAFFVGIGATKRIALFDTLVNQASTREVLAVVAHEVGHERLGHVRSGLIISICHLFALLYLMSVVVVLPLLCFGGGGLVVVANVRLRTRADLAQVARAVFRAALRRLLCLNPLRLRGPLALPDPLLAGRQVPLDPP